MAILYMWAKSNLFFSHGKGSAGDTEALNAFISFVTLSHKYLLFRIPSLISLTTLTCQYVLAICGFEFFVLLAHNHTDTCIVIINVNVEFSNIIQQYKYRYRFSNINIFHNPHLILVTKVV